MQFEQKEFQRQLNTPINSRPISQNSYNNNSFSNQANNNYMNNNMNYNNNMNPNNMNNMNMNSFNNNSNMNNINMPRAMNNNMNNNMILNSYTYNMNNKLNLNNDINNNDMNNINISNIMNSNISNNMNSNINNMSNNFNNGMNNIINFNNSNLNNGMNIGNNMNNNNNMYNNMNMNMNFNNSMNNNNISNSMPPINTPFSNNINGHMIIPINPEPQQYPALIGLNNIGATCFMNSTLQCMSQIGEFSSYFLNEKNNTAIINNNIARKNDNQLTLSPLYLDLIEHLWNKSEPNRAFSPINFIKRVEDMNPLFKLGQAGDSKDFILFLLEQLHTELKKPCSNYRKMENRPLNQYDRSNALNHFMDEFKKELSIVTDIFFGIQETRTQCFNCRNIYSSQGRNPPICYNFQIFNFIIFPLEEVRKMKNRNNFNNSDINIVNLYDCFKYNQEPIIFTGENRNHCNICNKLNDCSYTTLIYSAPNILILILNRGKDNKFKVKIDFSEDIDITDFVQMKPKNKRLKYSLTGVITHLGESGPDAHFIASCKSSVNNKWYRFNDALVNIINNVQQEIFYFGTPYILFYRIND